MKWEKLLNLAERLSERHGVKYFEIRLVRVFSTSISIQNGQVEEIGNNFEMGLGVRAFKNGWGFSSANDLSRAEKVVETAMKIAKLSRASTDVYLGDPVVDEAELTGEKKLEEVGIEEKLSLAVEADRLLLGEKIRSRSSGYSDTIVETLYLNSLGSIIRSRVSRVRLRVMATAFENGKMQEFWRSFGGVGGWEIVEKVELDRVASFVSAKARELLNAKAPPSGEFDVVMDPELTGVFIHEAVGHAAEADAVRNGESIFARKLGERVGIDELNVVDDPSLPGKFGSYVYDDEGMKGKRVEIIKNGIINAYLNDRETAKVLELEPNGHGRAQSYAHQPLVRMSNTYVEAGTWEPEEIFEEVRKGLYMVGDRGGEVDVASGNFTFGASYGYLIENGELGEMVKDVALSGNLIEVLKNISAIGRDVRVSFPGYCGKGQWVPVDDGGPHVLTRALVGGR